jgi:DNA polymerase-4
MNIHFIRDILNYSPEALEEKLGKTGVDLWHKAQGKHAGAVVQHHDAKSISTENTFEENTADIPFLLSELVRMAERVGYELRQDEKLAGCIAVKIRYFDFETTSRQTTIDYTFRDDELIPAAISLFHKLYKKGRLVRLLGVRLSELANHAIQGSLFDDGTKKNGLYKAIDDVKNKFGRSALQKGRAVKLKKRE